MIRSDLSFQSGSMHKIGYRFVLSNIKVKYFLLASLKSLHSVFFAFRFCPDRLMDFVLGKNPVHFHMTSMMF